VTISDRLSRLISQLLDRVMCLIKRPLDSVGAERVIRGEVNEVLLMLERTLNWREVGGGSWSPWKGYNACASSATISFKYRPGSLANEATTFATLPLTLQFVVNKRGQTTALSWAYSSDGLNSQSCQSLIDSTDEIIENLLTQCK
jgi:hypothetical protein